MSSAFHGGQTANHLIENWTFANATDRVAGTGYTILVTDEGKIAYQSDTGAYYRLVSIGPLVWTSIVGTGVVQQPVAFMVSGKPSASQIIGHIKFCIQTVFPASLTGSQGDALIAATASTVFTLKKNGSSIGTATFAISGTVPTFSFGSAVTFAVGDVLTITAPATPDATLADISFDLLGTS
jgi:hypothetical protein